jgi:hypothetical protein
VSGAIERRATQGRRTSSSQTRLEFCQQDNGGGSTSVRAPAWYHPAVDRRGNLVKWAPGA